MSKCKTITRRCISKNVTAFQTIRERKEDIFLVSDCTTIAMKQFGFLVSLHHRAIAVPTFSYPLKDDALSMLKLWLRTWYLFKLTNRMSGFQSTVYLSQESFQGKVIFINKKETMVTKHRKMKTCKQESKRYLSLMMVGI